MCASCAVDVAPDDDGGICFLQDMACETFLKICQRCKQQFVKHQPQEQSPFIDQLLIGSSTVADIGSTIADLEAHQVRNSFWFWHRDAC